MRLLKALLLCSLFLAGAAQAKIGWTYEECVAHWGPETGHFTFWGPDDHLYGPLEFHPCFIFKLPNAYYMMVEIQDDKVVEENFTDEPGF